MRTAKTVFTLIIAALIWASAFSQTTLRFYNNTDKDIYAAYVSFSNSNGWVSHGWYKLPPYQNFDIDLHDYSGKVYIHGMQHRLMGLEDIKWGDGRSFCVDPENAFSIHWSDKINCEHRRQFFELKVDAGLNKWTFNP